MKKASWKPKGLDKWQPHTYEANLWLNDLIPKISGKKKLVPFFPKE